MGCPTKFLLMIAQIFPGPRLRPFFFFVGRLLLLYVAIDRVV